MKPRSIAQDLLTPMTPLSLWQSELTVEKLERHSRLERGQHPMTQPEQILAVLTDYPKSIDDLVAATGINRRCVRTALTSLVNTGRVTRCARAMYVRRKR